MALVATMQVHCRYHAAIMIHIQVLTPYLVCPHKSAGIAKGPWSFRSTSHHWC